MKLSSFVLACLAIIVHAISGELIPGRMLEPRVKLESVRHVRSPTILGQAGSGMKMDRLQPVRYARKAQSLLDGFLDATVVTDFVDAPPTDSPDSIDFDALAKFLADSSILPGGASSFLPQAQAKREVTAPKAHATASADRRRRRTESLPGRRQASRAPSGTVRQPIKRSTAPRNLPDQ